MFVALSGMAMATITLIDPLLRVDEAPVDAAQMAAAAARIRGFAIFAVLVGSLMLYLQYLLG